MTSIRIENFAGIAPRWSNRLLPKNGAVTASNAKLLSGELRGLRETQLLNDFSSTYLDAGSNSTTQPVARAYRLPASVAAPIPLQGGDFWVGFKDATVDFVRTPVLEDAYERYYWTGDSLPSAYAGAPQYNTRARIQAGSASFLLGIPTPIDAPTVTPPGGTTETRAYVYTFVSAYGEEGSPSPPTTATGASSGTWALSGIDSTVANPSHYNITTTRIYRAIAGTYYHVADISFGTTTFNDTASDTSVALNYTLPSLTWTPPPAGLQGITPHPGGFLMGFSGRDFWCSAPYQPHAWPIQNVQTCQTEIVGIAVVSGVVVVTTTSHPYFAEGMTPQAIILQRIDSVDPCVNRRSMVTTLQGVMYASPQGIILATPGQTALQTQQLFTREEWQDYFSPTQVQAVGYGLQYIAFYSTAAGFIFSPSETLAPLTTLDRFNGVQAVQIDAYSGDVYLVQSNQTRLWDPPQSIPYEYTWLSKEFDIPKPVNWGAFRLKFNGGSYTIADELLADYTTFNTDIYGLNKPLCPINGSVINGPPLKVTLTDQASIIPQNMGAINGSSLYLIDGLANVSGAVQVTIYARDLDQSWNVIFDYSVTTERTFRLPTGYKSDGLQVQLIGNIPIYSFAIAETGKELQEV